MLGYLRIIDRDKQKEFNHRDSLFKYSIGDVYGYSGIEKSYENALRGRNGVEYRVVDNRGVDHGEFNQKDGLEIINGWLAQYNDHSGQKAIIQGLYNNKYINKDTTSIDELLDAIIA